MLHGLIGLVLFGVALRAGMLARSGRTEEVAVTATTSQEPEVV
jgi:hypothetical protein